MLAKNYFFTHEQQTLAFGAELAQLVSAPAIIFLEGDLGTGKTTLVRGFLRELQWQDKVKSPTYTLVESYEFENFTVHHCDLYRLQTMKDLLSMGFEEYLHDASILLIEWPKVCENFLPQPDLHCHLAYAEGGRQLQLVADTVKGKNWLG